MRQNARTPALTGALMGAVFLVSGIPFIGSWLVIPIVGLGIVVCGWFAMLPLAEWFMLQGVLNAGSPMILYFEETATMLSLPYAPMWFYAEIILMAVGLLALGFILVPASVGFVLRHWLRKRLTPRHSGVLK